MDMKRVVDFLPPQTVKASAVLAARYGSNRSEVRLRRASSRFALCLLGCSGFELRSWARSPGLLPVPANGLTGQLRLVPLGSFRSMRRRLFLNSSSTACPLDAYVQVSRRRICG